MGVVRMPLKGRWIIAKIFRIDTDPNRARKAINAAYVQSGGTSPDLKRAYRAYAAAKKAREATN